MGFIGIECPLRGEKKIRFSVKVKICWKPASVLNLKM